MDSGRPKQPTGTGVSSPGHPALESVVRTHSEQLIKLNTELSSAFAQVTGEMGDLRTSTTSTSAALATQVMVLTDLVTCLLPAAPPVAPPPRLPLPPPLLLQPNRWTLDGSRLCLRPTPMLGSLTDAAGSWDSASYSSSTKLPVSGLMEPV